MNLQCNFDFEYFDFGFLLLLTPLSFPSHTHTLCTLSRSSAIRPTGRPEKISCTKERYTQVRCRDARERNYLYDKIVVTIVREFQKYLSVEGKNTFFCFLTPKHSTLSVRITYLICVKEISLRSRRFTYQIYVSNTLVYLFLSFSTNLVSLILNITYVGYV